MASMDLKNAYYPVPVHEKIQKGNFTRVANFINFLH